MAKPPTELPRNAGGDSTMRSMLQGLLAERFRLSVHREQREMPSYVLTVGREGPRLKEATTGTPGGDSTGRTLIRGHRMSMIRLARLLSGQLGEMVADHTQLGGEYDVQLDFAPVGLEAKVEGSPDSDRPSIFAALQEIGLRLERRRVRVETLVIDSVERPESN